MPNFISSIIATLLVMLLVCCCPLRASSTETNVTSQMPDQEAAEEDVEHLKTRLMRTRFMIQKIVGPLVVLFGVVGNAINIAVLTQTSMRTSSTNTYLTALAVFDILYLTFGLTMSLKHYEIIKQTVIYTRYRLPWGKPIVDTCSNTTVWITLTFTVERYIGVCHPMKGRRWCTPERARFITIAVCAAAYIITFPEFFEFHVVESIDTKTNQTQYTSRMTDFGMAIPYQWGYVYMNQALFTFLPLFFLIIFNILLVRAVMHASRRRKDMVKYTTAGGTENRQEKQNREQQKITVMLISVVIVFLVCQLPQAVMNLYVTYLQVSNHKRRSTWLQVTIASNVFNLLVQLNSSANFILYSAFSNRFRRVFKQLFCRCLADNTPNRYSMGTFTGAGVHHSKTNSKTDLVFVHNSPSRTSICSKRGSFIKMSNNLAEVNSEPKSYNKNGYLAVKQEASFVYPAISKACCWHT